MEFYVVLIKKSWIRNAEIRGGEKAGEKETWMPINMPGHAGFYLAEDAQEACGYAAEEHGYPRECFVAVNLNRMLVGDFKEFGEVKEEI